MLNNFIYVRNYHWMAGQLRLSKSRIEYMLSNDDKFKQIEL